MWNKLLCIQNGTSSQTNVSLKIRLWSVFLLAWFQVILSSGEETWNPTATGCLEKEQINLEADILPMSGTGKCSTLAWHHNSCELMLGASFSLELSERVWTEHRNPQETEEVMTYGSWKMHPVLIFWQGQWGCNEDHAWNLQLLGPEKSNPHTMVQVGNSHKPKEMCDWATKCSDDQMLSKFINLIPNHQTGIIRFNAQHRFGLKCVNSWNKTWKRRPLPTMQGRWRDWVTLWQAPILIESLKDSWLHNMRLPLVEAVKQQPLSSLLAWISTRRHICFQWIYSTGLWWYKSQCLSPCWWTWQLHWNLKTENKHYKVHQHKKISERLTFTFHKKSPEEDWSHNWHKPEKASGTMVAPATQWWGQWHLLLCPLGSVVVAEPHHAGQKLLLAPLRWWPL